MKITVKTFTPVCIRSGETLTPLSDFVIEGQKVAFIDRVKLQSLFRENQPILRDFTKMALSGKGDVKTFLQEHKLSYQNFTLFSLSLFKSGLEGHSRQLALPVSSAQGGYLPGSSLKGMLRSALLFRYFKDNASATENIFEEKPYIGGNVFRREACKIDQDALRFVRISDSSFVSWEQLVVYELKRLTPRGSIPMLIVGVPQNVEFSFDLRIDSWFEKAPIPEYWKNLFRDGEGTLLEAIRSYTQQVLEKEIQILSTLKIYNRLCNFYRKIHPSLQKQILFRLGFGKTYYFNSVGCLLSEKELRKIFNKERRIRIGVSFPSTRFVISSSGDEQIPLGWIVVAKIG